MSTNATTIYLVRHGETNYNRRRIVQGWKVNSTLNPTGIRQAEALGAYLSDVPFDAIYSSALSRAQQTAEIVLAHQQVQRPIHVIEELAEMRWGVIEGMEYEEELVQENLTAAFQAWGAGDFGFRIKGAETILEVQQRGVAAVNTIAERHPGQIVLVITHGRFLRVVLASLLPEYGLERMQDLLHTNTGINELVYEDGYVEARRLNAVDHLAVEAE